MDHILLKIVRQKNIEKDIIIYLSKEGFEIKYDSLDYIRTNEKIYNDANEKLFKEYGITGKSHLDEIIFEEKIKGKETDTILNEIFGGGYK